MLLKVAFIAEGPFINYNLSNFNKFHGHKIDLTILVFFPLDYYQPCVMLSNQNTDKYKSKILKKIRLLPLILLPWPCNETKWQRCRQNKLTLQRRRGLNYLILKNTKIF